LEPSFYRSGEPLRHPKAATESAVFGKLWNRAFSKPIQIEPLGGDLIPARIKTVMGMSCAISPRRQRGEGFGAQPLMPG
jgi:hypothetical protein